MKYTIFLLAIICIFSCIDKNTVLPTQDDFGDNTMVLDTQNIDFTIKNSIQRRPVLFLESMNTDNFILPLDREYLIFNPHNVDSVKMVRTNPAFANLGTTTGYVPVTNYSATFFFKNGNTELFSVLSKVRDDKFTWIPDVTKSIVSPNVTENILKFVKTKITETKRLPYRGNTVRLSKWQFSTKVNDSFVIIDTLLLYPESKSSMQWAPLQLF